MRCRFGVALGLIAIQGMAGTAAGSSAFASGAAQAGWEPGTREANTAVAAAERSRALVGQANAARDRGDVRTEMAFLAAAVRAEPSDVEARERLLLALSMRRFQPQIAVLRHGKAITKVVLGPGGRRLLTVADDGTARLWGAERGQPMSGLLAQGEAITSASFSADGRQVVTVSLDGMAIVRDSGTGRPIGKALKHTGVTSAAFSPDGTQVVTASVDGTARVWEAGTGKALPVVLRHRAAVNGAEFSPDGERIVTASDDRTARVWDAATGRAVGETLQHVGRVRSAGFRGSAGGHSSLVVTESPLDGVRLWSASSGKPLLEREVDEPDQNLRDGVTGIPVDPPVSQPLLASSVAVSRNGAVVQLFENGHVLDWWIGRGGRRTDSPDYYRRAGATQVAVSVDGTRRLVVHPAGVDLLSTYDGYEKSRRLEGSGGALSVEFSEDGKQVVGRSADGSVRVWDTERRKVQGLAFWEAESRALVAEPLRQGSRVLAARFALGRERIVTESEDGIVRIWGAEPSRRTLPLVPAEDSYRDVVFSRDGRWIFAVAGSAVHVFNARTGTKTGSLSRAHDPDILAAAFGPDGKLFTATADSTIQPWDPATAKALRGSFRCEPDLSFAVFSPDARRVATVSDEDPAVIWLRETGRPGLPPTPIQAGGAVVDAAFSPDGRRMVVAVAGSNLARIWEVETRRPIDPPLEHDAAVGSVAFSPDGRMVLTTSKDRMARLWDSTLGKPAVPPFRHDGDLTSASINPDGRWVATVSGEWKDAALRVWSAQTGRLLHVRHLALDLASPPLLRVSFGPDDRLVIAGSMMATDAWKIDVPDVPPPDWFLDFADALVLFRVGPGDLPEELSPEETATRIQVSSRAVEEPGTAGSAYAGVAASTLPGGISPTTRAGKGRRANP